VDVAGVDTSKFDDAYFKSAEKKGKKQSEEGFFQEKAEKAPLPAEYVANQKAVDAALLGKLRCAAATRCTARPPLWRSGALPSVARALLLLDGGGRGQAHRVPACQRGSCAVGTLRRHLNAWLFTCRPPRLPPTVSVQRRAQGLPLQPLHAALWRPAAPHEVLSGRWRRLQQPSRGVGPVHHPHGPHPTDV
jgi:hypothetical protein